MKYAVPFTVLGLYLTALAAYLGGPGLLLLWPGASLVLLGAAYAGLGPRVYGKGPDGRLAWWAVLPMLPFLLFTWAVWHAQRRLSREDCCNEVAPGLWLGRRAFFHELPPGIALVVDLTAEFPAPRALARGTPYLCLPTLDALAPSPDALRVAVERITATSGGVYVHCALGHGRSATVAAAVLLARGLADDVAHAEAVLRRARPGVRLMAAQRRVLERLAAPGGRGG
jgi:protein-tyrosine phosphatase